MLSAICLFVRKDLHFAMGSGGIFIQALMVGILPIFLMGLTASELAAPSPRLAASAFWLASLISCILTAPALYEHERPCLAALLILPAGSRTIWLCKAISVFIVLALAQLFYLAATGVFFNIGAASLSFDTAIGWALCNAGLCAISAMFAPLAKTGRERHLAAILLVPACLPLLMAGINLASLAFISENGAGVWRTLLFTAATDMVFISLALLLSPFLFRAAANE